METEYEATFWPVDKDEMRQKLEEAGATLVYPERLMRRYVYYLPDTSPLKGAWARVRDEGDKITMSIKQSGTSIEEQKEAQIVIDSFEAGAAMLRNLGCHEQAYQESKRELWKLGNTEITLDEWPFLKPFIEIEGPGEEIVRAVSEKLGFDWKTAEFCSVDVLYVKQYGFSNDVINRQTPRLVFGEANPLLKYAGNGS